MSTRTTRSIRLVFSVGPVAAAALMLATGCNTVKGLGRDITGAAESTEEAFSGWSEPDEPTPTVHPYGTTKSYSYRR